MPRSTWTKDEELVLERMWKSSNCVIADNVQHLGNRSVDSINSKARRMGLPTRCRARDQGPTWWNAKTIMAFHQGPIAGWQIAHKLGLSTSTVLRHIRLHRDEVYVAGWVGGEKDCRYVQAFALGPGIDVPKPQKGQRKVKQDMRQRKHLREGKVNVFESLIKQVTL